MEVESSPWSGCGVADVGYCCNTQYDQLQPLLWQFQLSALQLQLPFVSTLFDHGQCMVLVQGTAQVGLYHSAPTDVAMD